MPHLLPLIVAVFLFVAGVSPPPDGRDAGPSASGLFDYMSILGFAPDVEPGVIGVGTLGQVLELQPGEERVLALGRYDFERCGVGVACFIPAPFQATWSVAPEPGARIDRERGVLTIDPDTAAGSQFTVTAAVAGGSDVTAEVYVYTPESNPFVGYWVETAQISCDDGSEIVPEQEINELVFAADGRFAVTWVPFESYVDYWGEYDYDLDDGTLDLTVTGSIQSPDDIDGEGRFTIDANGDLVMTDIWLGTSQWAEDDTAHCGHRFAR